MTAPRRCFVIMPFLPELNYFYLYFRHHLEEKFPVEVERADNHVLTKPMMEKIRTQIQESDFVIGDITGRNANVFYELGIAEALGKPSILITRDAISEAPSDLKHREFVPYDLAKETEFLKRLDNAVHNVLAEPYAGLYEQAITLLKRFNKKYGRAYTAASKELFQTRVLQGERTVELESDVRTDRFLLPRIIEDPGDVEVMEFVTRWLTEATS